MSNKKKAIDLSGISKDLARRLENTSGDVAAGARGIAGDPVLEAVPVYNETESEKTIQGKNNSWIILGRDRPAGKASGYGGKGDTQCGMIDLVVGRMGSKPKSVDDKGGKIFADPNFTLDSARIYISQKTDIDEDFGLAAGSIGIIKAKSGIGLKADGVRIIGREGIKFVTGTDKKNSQGAEVKEIVGVDLIAGNLDKDLEPMVKGDALVACLNKLSEHVEQLTGIVDGMLKIQNNMNEAVTQHKHYSPLLGKPTSPSPTVAKTGAKTMIDHMGVTKRDLMKHKQNLIVFKNNFLKPLGKKYINSRYNNTN